jgi:hypothetical protein
MQNPSLPLPSPKHSSAAPGQAASCTSSTPKGRVTNLRDFAQAKLRLSDSTFERHLVSVADSDYQAPARNSVAPERTP